ncbi:(2Fe-2S)-binding protein [Roseinatronobacter alkalisoli]|uniref:(2Fe-2S)-binding protein n=1 Tax=Roseinatronobacter alkalisoli TaxID=3028235 RepID=A0ABT5TDD4_9RHOB|nr:(2Fe-2S)-binding protein [Roseinatronobacter sp. HJB301]MDD7972167.1 (2Fe-2S)-binding protein [Roseinatronobacter sp. HJB301]
MRLVPDHSGRIRRSALVEFTFDDAPVKGHAGESLAVALIRAGHLHLRDAPEDGAPRGAFCCMGLCQECVIGIDGLAVESCREIVAPGLVVTSFRGRA